MRLIFRIDRLRKILVDNKQLFNKPLRNYVLLADFDQLCGFIYERRGRTAYNFIRFEKPDNRVGFFSKVLMAFVNDDFKCNTAFQCLVYPFGKTCALAVF